MDTKIDFNSPIYENDPRFTCGLIEAEEEPGFYADMMERQQYARETGIGLFGHSSADLLEQALAMPAGSLAGRYAWPEGFNPDTPARHEVNVFRFAGTAYSYAIENDHKTLQRKQLSADNYFPPDTAVPGAYENFIQVKALNAKLAELNPALFPALEASLSYEKEGFFFNSLNFLWGVLYKFPPEDILLYQHTSAANFFHIQTRNETNLGVDIWEDYKPYAYTDMHIGWVMSSSTARKVLDAVCALKADAVPPGQNRYFDPGTVYPFQQAFEQLVAQKHAEYLAAQNGSGPNTIVVNDSFYAP